MSEYIEELTKKEIETIRKFDIEGIKKGLGGEVKLEKMKLSPPNLNPIRTSNT